MVVSQIIQIPGGHRDALCDAVGKPCCWSEGGGLCAGVGELGFTPQEDLVACFLVVFEVEAGVCMSEGGICMSEGGVCCGEGGES